MRIAQRVGFGLFIALALLELVATYYRWAFVYALLAAVWSPWPWPWGGDRFRTIDLSAWRNR